MKKITLTTLAVLLALCIFAAGCTPGVTIESEDSESQPITTGSAENGTLIVFDDGSKAIVTDSGKIIRTILCEDNRIDTAQTGCRFEDLPLNEDGLGGYSVDVTLCSWSWSSGGEVWFDCDNTELAIETPRALLDRLVNSGLSNALSAYSIDSAVYSMETDSGLAVVTFDYRYTPAAWAWSWPEYNPFSGGEPAESLGSAAVSVVGCDGRWAILDDDGLIYSVDASYQPEPITFTPAENQTFVYENDKMALYYEQTMLGDAPDDGSMQPYKTDLCCRTADGATVTLLADLDNFSFTYLADYKGNVFLQSDYWIPYSEGFRGNLYAISAQDFSVTEIEASYYVTEGYRDEKTLTVAAGVNEIDYVIQYDHPALLHLDTLELTPIE